MRELSREAISETREERIATHHHQTGIQILKGAKRRNLTMKSIVNSDLYKRIVSHKKGITVSIWNVKKHPGLPTF